MNLKSILSAKEYESYSKCNRLILDEINLHDQHNIELKSMLQETWMTTETKLHKQLISKIILIVEQNQNLHNDLKTLQKDLTNVLDTKEYEIYYK